MADSRNGSGRAQADRIARKREWWYKAIYEKLAGSQAIDERYEPELAKIYARIAKARRRAETWTFVKDHFVSTMGASAADTVRFAQDEIDDALLTLEVLVGEYVKLKREAVAGYEAYAREMIRGGVAKKASGGKKLGASRTTVGGKRRVSNGPKNGSEGKDGGVDGLKTADPKLDEMMKAFPGAKLVSVVASADRRRL